MHLSRRVVLSSSSVPAAAVVGDMSDARDNVINVNSEPARGMSACARVPNPVHGEVTAGRARNPYVDVSSLVHV